jgi:heterodisulfide reductase subunit D
MSLSPILEEALYRCNKCGFCQATCPFYQTQLEEWAVARGRLRVLRGVQEGNLPLSSGYVRALYNCFSCGACASTCPSGVPVEDILFQARRDAARDALLPEPLTRLGRTISDSGSLTGETGDMRLSWTQNLDFTPRQSGTHDLIYFVGCVSSLYPAAYGLPQSMVSLLESKGEDYAILGGDEVCCGYPLYVSGLVDEARALAEANLRTVREAGASRLITTCPSCFRAWREFYPELLGEDTGLEVLHVTQWLAGADLPMRPLEMRVTYQDPCDLGRASGIYDAPRQFLSSLPGATLVEMAYSRAEALCCGGGGNMESLDSRASKSVTEMRLEQASDTGANLLVTSCPQCKRTLASGHSKGRRVRVVDIVELARRVLAAD